MLFSIHLSAKYEYDGIHFTNQVWQKLPSSLSSMSFEPKIGNQYLTVILLVAQLSAHSPISVICSKQSKNRTRTHTSTYQPVFNSSKICHRNLAYSIRLKW